MTLEVPRLQDIAGDAVSNLYNSTLRDQCIQLQKKMDAGKSKFIKHQKQLMKDFLTKSCGFEMCVAKKITNLFVTEFFGCEDLFCISMSDLQHLYFRCEQGKRCTQPYYELKNGLYMIDAPPGRQYGIYRAPDLSNGIHISEVLMFANGVPISTEKTELASRVTALLFPPALRRSKRTRD